MIMWCCAPTLDTVRYRARCMQDGTQCRYVYITNFCRLAKRKWQVTTVNIDKSIEHQQSAYQQRYRMSDSLRKLSFLLSFDGGEAYILSCFPGDVVSMYVGRYVQCRPSQIQRMCIGFGAAEINHYHWPCFVHKLVVLRSTGFRYYVPPPPHSSAPRLTASHLSAWLCTAAERS